MGQYALFEIDNSEDDDDDVDGDDDESFIISQANGRSIRRVVGQYTE